MIFFLTWPKSQAFSKTSVPLFVNRNALFKHGTKKLPRARGLWAIDSGGYTELSQHGRWTITEEQYAQEVRRAVREIGAPHFAPVLDYMCEDSVLAKTGLSVEEHQWRTVESYLKLRALAPELNHLWMPVLQGRDPEDYVEHFHMHLAHGVDLRRVNMVGVGSVCRRWVGQQLADIFERLHELGLRRLHGFGAKEESFERTGKLSKLRAPGNLFYDELYYRALERGLEAEWLLHPETGVTWEDSDVSTCSLLASADSAAWSSRARKQSLEVWLARQEDARRRGHDPEAVKRSGYCVDHRGKVFYGKQEIGPVAIERAGTRVGTLPLEEAVLLPTQVLVECASNTARGLKGKSHTSCNMCPAWALEYRRRLKAVVEPYGCWEETVSLPAIGAVDFEAEQRERIRRATELRDRWEGGWRP